MYKYWLFFIIAITQLSVSAQYSFKGVVVDELSKPVAEAKIALANSEIYSITDAKGNFNYSLSQAPSMPIKVKMVKSGYELKEINFDDEGKFLEVIIRKLTNPEQGKVEALQLVSDSTLSFKWVSMLVDGNTYTADESGLVKLTYWATYNSDVLIPGYQIEEKEYVKKTKTLILNIKPYKLEDELVAALNEPASYQKSFETLFRQFEMEKKIIIESNQKIEREINSIIEQLTNDSSLTEADRKQLLSYLSNLETLYETNKSTLENAIEKKYNMIFRMKMLIMQKDSINLVSKKELEEAKNKQQELDAVYTARMTYSIIVIVVILIALIIVGLNIRKIKKQKIIIEDQNRSLDAFVSKASHEIKGPLNSLKGLSDVALKTIQDKEAIQYFEYINKTAQKLTKTVNNMLYFSKAKELKPEYTEVRVKEFLDEIISSLAYKEGFDTIKIHNTVPEGIQIKSDETILNSVLQNLISNAIKYQDNKKEDSYLNITCQEKNQQLVIEFLDNGIGIDSIHREKLFGMFYRATNEAEGTGLGLYIVKLSIEKLGGTITFESEPKKFTKFIVTLPYRR